jgi:hypothetical protein
MVQFLALIGYMAIYAGFAFTYAFTLRKAGYIESVMRMASDHTLLWVIVLCAAATNTQGFVAILHWAFVTMHLLAV